MNYIETVSYTHLIRNSPVFSSIPKGKDGSIHVVKLTSVTSLFISERISLHLFVSIFFIINFCLSESKYIISKIVIHKQ